MISTFPNDVISNRVSRASALLAGANVDLLLVTPSADLQYLAGYGGHASERLTVYALSPGEAPKMVVPRLEAPRLSGRSDIDLRSYGDGENPYVCLRSAVAGRSEVISIAISDQAWASVLLEFQSLFPTATFVSAARLLRPLRMVKCSDELELLHDAGRRVDRAFQQLVTLSFAGRREMDVANDLDRLLQGEHLGRASWGPIVASGPNSASPHHVTGDREIRAGDAVVLDFGGELSGYQADITRTVHVGPASTRFEDAYELVLRAQQAGYEASIAGRTAEQVDRAARTVIRDGGFGDYFVHRAGHGLGLDIHEEPYLVAGNDLRLEVGMTFSVEPGIYLPGDFGIRIEDTVAVYSDGPRRFNEATRELQIVE